MTTPRPDRRALLQKAAVGGAVVWAAPVVLSGAPAGAGVTSPLAGCTIVPIVEWLECGGPWEVRVGFDADACPGATWQLDAVNGIPEISLCNDLTRSLGIQSGGPFTSTCTFTLRTECNGAVLAGPTDVVVDAVAGCEPAGAAAGTTAPEVSDRTVTLTAGDRTIEIPAAG